MGKAIVSRRGGAGVVTGAVPLDTSTQPTNEITIPAAVGKKNIVVYMKSVYMNGGDGFIICAHSVDGDGTSAVGCTLVSPRVDIYSKSATWSPATGKFYCSKYQFYPSADLYHFVAW